MRQQLGKCWNHSPTCICEDTTYAIALLHRGLIIFHALVYFKGGIISDSANVNGNVTISDLYLIL